MSEERGSVRWLAALGSGLVIGSVQLVVAIAFAGFVFSGIVGSSVADGIAIFGVGAGVTLALFALRAGRRGIVGGLQGAAAAVVALVTTSTSLGSFGGPSRAFLTVVLTTMVVTASAGVVCLVLGSMRRGNLLRFVPYPIVGGLLAGAGWLLIRGAIGVAVGEPPSLLPLGDLIPGEELVRWVPAIAFGFVVLAAARIVRRPLTVPVALAIGLAAFAVGMAVTGNTIQEARSFGWLMLGPFDDPHVWEAWPARAVTGADPAAVLWQALGVVAAISVSVVAIGHHVSETGSILGRDLDTNRELRDAGIANAIAGAFGGLPGAHALDATHLTDRSRADARVTGFVAALVPIAGVAVGASIVALLPRMIAGGLLAYLGSSLIVEWLWDRRRTLSRVEYLVVALILVVVIARGFLPGVVVAVVMAVVLFAVSYSRVESLRRVAFGATFRSNVDRPPDERAALGAVGDDVEILRVDGFVFFGSTNVLLERIRARVDAGPLRFLVLDLRRVTGVDSSAVASIEKVVQVAQAKGFELIVAGASGAVRGQLARGRIVATEGIVLFEPDLDRALERCEDALLAHASLGTTERAAVPMPRGLDLFVERVPLEQGQALIHQDEPPDDVFVLESGLLRVEMRTHDGGRMRLRTIRPGVMVGEIGMYTGARRTADVVADAPSVVLRLRRTAIERMQVEQPDVAAAVHRWLAGTLAERLTDSQRAVETLMG